MSALLFPSGNKGLLPHIIALTLLIYGTVDSVEYILNFGTNFKQSHVESFLKTKPVKAFILWFQTEVKIDDVQTQRDELHLLCQQLQDVTSCIANKRGD